MGVLLALFCLAGCAQEITLRARVGAKPPQPDPLSIEGGIELDSFSVVLSDVRFESTPTVGDTPSPGRKYLVHGPQRLELAGDQLLAHLIPFAENIHSGAYDYYELDADLSPPPGGNSVEISGRFRDAPFHFTSASQAVLKGAFVFRIGTNHNSVDLNFDPNRWFTGADGGVLDPSDPAQQGAIEENLVHSFSAYEDDDLDGAPDSLG